MMKNILGCCVLIMSPLTFASVTAILPGAPKAVQQPPPADGQGVLVTRAAVPQGTEDTPMMVSLAKEQEGLFKDVTISPIGSSQSLSIDILRYQIVLADGPDAFKIPFFLAFGQSKSTTDKENAEATLLDPTDGWNVRIPFYARVGNGWNRLCNFSNAGGTDYGCRVGVELGVAWKKFEAKEISKQSVGYTAKVSAAGLFPVTKIGGADGNTAGYLSFDVGAIYHHYDDADLKAAYGQVTDENGNAVVYGDEFGAWTVTAQLDVYDTIAVQMSFISPMGSQENLDDIFKISVTKSF